MDKQFYSSKIFAGFLLTHLRFSEVVFSHFITKILQLLLKKSSPKNSKTSPRIFQWVDGYSFSSNFRPSSWLWRIWKIGSLGDPDEVYVDTCQFKFELALRLNKPSRSDFLKSVPHFFFCGIQRAISQYIPRGLNFVRTLSDLKLKRKAKKLWTDNILSFVARLEIWDYQEPRKPNFPKAIDRDFNDHL